MLKQINKIIATFLLLGIISACTVQKSRSDLSKLGEFYHNTTAHYNGYFNANELLVASIVNLENQHEDNYTKLLPLYKYLEAENPQAAAPDLNLAIEKVSVVVNLHRFSRWTDDCYLLFGKAKYLQRDYESAEEAFRFFSNEFTPEKMNEEKKESKAERKSSKKKKSSASKKSSKKKKKEREKERKQKSKARKKYNNAVRKARKQGKKPPEKPAILRRGDEKAELAKEEAKKKNEEEAKAKREDAKKDKDGLGHRPAYQEGMVWYAKTLIERNKYDGAERILDDLENDRKTYNDILTLVAAVRAHSYIKQKKYDLAIPAMREAIKLESDKEVKSRYAYVLAQLFELQNNYKGAYDGYEESLKYRPSYTMAFNCRLNMAQNAYASGKGTAIAARNNLEKLLKDPKNDLYKDQIYYAMAEIDMKASDLPSAINNYQLSVKYNVQNRAQKAESYLALADIYFDEENYVSAKNYYDSTLQVMSASDERYKNVESYANNLKDIAENIQIITLQDSLLRLSQLTKEEKEAVALEIKKQRDEERRRQLAAKAASNQPGVKSRVARPGGGSLQKESSFFAYDDRAIKRGEREFSRKWGIRSLEDDWRRSNRSDASSIDDNVFASDDSGILTEEEIDKLLGDVPGSDAEIAAAELKMQEAMSKLGVLYRERLESNEKAIAILEKLNERFPGNTYELDSWYQLYLAYTDEGQPAKAKIYADKIIDKYPNTAYALIIQNPNYAEELVKEEQQLNDYYDNAYAHFTSGDYKEAYEKSIAAKDKFGAANPLQPKFALLSAMSTGSISGKEAYIQELKNVVARYPDTEEQRRAKEILRLLGETSAALPGGAQEAMKDFTLEDDKLHYVIIVFSNQDIKLNDAKVGVSDYNQKYHKLDRLRISNIYLGADANSRLPILVLRRFKNKDKAMEYFNGTTQLNKKDFLDEKMNFEVFPITQNNYRQILKDKSVDNYRLFFQANYLD
jgi:tetratricopeptide (TPR) repeat protein